jgi:hypothetical protein
MANAPVISLEKDAVPIVRIISILLHNAAEDADICARIGKLSGSISFQSSTDLQTATVSFKSGEIQVKRGIEADATLAATLDLNRPIILSAEITLDGEDKNKAFATEVRNIFARHPLDWKQAAGNFWSLYAGGKGFPTAMAVNCSDDSEEITLGDSEVEINLYGAADALCDVFSCSTMLMAKVFTGEIKFQGELKHLNVLSGVYLDRITGELP